MRIQDDGYITVGNPTFTNLYGITIKSSGTVGSNAGHFATGQASNAQVYMAWKSNATASSAYAEIGTYGSSNPIAFQLSANSNGNVCIGTSNANSNIGQGLVLDNGRKLFWPYNVTYLGTPSNGSNGGNGTRIILWPGTASAPPYSIGMAGGTLW